MIKKVQIGVVGVDSGLLIIADPGNLIHTKLSKNFGKNWDGFCKIMKQKPEQEYKQFNYDHGKPGLAVVTSTIIGDGLYPIFYEEENGVIKKITIDLDIIPGLQK